MPTTVGDARDYLRTLLNEATASQWTDAMLDDYLYKGAVDIARRCETIEDREEISAVDGTQEYSLPTDMIRVYRCEYQPDGSDNVYPLEYRDFNAMDAVWWSAQKITTGIPATYSMWGMSPSCKLVVYPTPSEDGILRVFYYRLPAAFASDNTNIEVPEGWVDAVISHAEYLALRRDGDPRWQEAKSLYEEQLGTLYDVTRRHSDQAGMMTPGITPSIPYWLYSGD